MINGKILTVTLNPAIDRTLFIPGFKAGEVNRVEQDYSYAGGKGVNVASLLSDFDFELSVTGFLGKDNIAVFEDLFEKKMIENCFVTIEGDTRTGIKIVNEVAKETTDINFPGAKPSSDDIETLILYLRNNAEKFDWIVLAGSVPKGTSDDIYCRIINELKNLDVKIALDTSGKSLHKALLAKPDLIKPNIDELAELTGRELNNTSEIIEEINNLHNNGIETVIISMGADGALFSKDGSVFHAKPGEVNLVSTVGAGDAMVSGTIAGILLNYSIEDCAKLGTAFSMSALERITTDLPEKTELEELFNSVMIEKLN